MLRYSVSLACLTLSACFMVGPNYKEPEKPVAAHWLTNDPAVREAPIQNANWWHVFKDPTLTNLINYGYHNNLSLQIAGVRVLQNRALLAQSVGQLYPQQQALSGNYQYYRLGGSSLQSVLPSTFETAQLGFAASWELDFWGKYRRAILSNDAQFLASYAAFDSALVTLTADIATAYIDIRTTQEQIHITEKNIQIQKTALKIAKARYKCGQTSQFDVLQSQTELAQTEASIPQLRSALQQQKDVLAVLLGVPPDKVDAMLGKNHGIPKAPPGIAVGIPVEAMAKRPDIYQARLEAIAQSESIGATKANLYPSLSLTGTFAFAANTIGGNSIGDMFNWNNRTITAGPALSWPLLNYGQITNAVRAQDAVFQQALLKYVNLVLKAQQEVQDNMTQFIESKKAEQYLMTANGSAIQSTRLAIIRYREGESDYTPVLDSEKQQLQVQTSLTKAKGEVPKALIALYRALGGGWQIRGCNDIVPQQVKRDMIARTDWGSLLQQPNHQPPLNPTQQTKERYLPNW